MQIMGGRRNVLRAPVLLLALLTVVHCAEDGSATAERSRVLRGAPQTSLRWAYMPSGRQQPRYRLLHLKRNWASGARLGKRVPFDDILLHERSPAEADDGGSESWSAGARYGKRAAMGGGWSSGARLG